MSRRRRPPAASPCRCSVQRVGVGFLAALQIAVLFWIVPLGLRNHSTATGGQVPVTLEPPPPPVPPPGAAPPPPSSRGLAQDGVRQPLSSVASAATSAVDVHSPAVAPPPTTHGGDTGGAPVEAVKVEEEAAARDPLARIKLPQAVKGPPDQCAGQTDVDAVFLTYATHAGSDDKFCRFLRSAANMRVDVKVLHWGGAHRGNGNKLVITLKELQSLSPCTVVVFSDAFDVLYTNTAAELTAKFLAMGVPLLFSAECGCWPQITYKKGRQICMGTTAGGYPPSPTPFRFLNSGVYAGRAYAVQEHIQALLALHTSKGMAGMCDQETSSNLFLSGASNITLDYKQELFANMHVAHDFGTCDPLASLVNTAGLLENTATGASPGMLHFNGGSKGRMVKMESSLWYMGTDRQPLGYPPLSAHELRGTRFPITDGQGTPATATFEQLCGRHTTSLLSGKRSNRLRRSSHGNA